MTEDHHAELDEIVAMLGSAGLLIETTEDGKPALQLTLKGAQVATQMAMSSEDDAAAMFNALLYAAEADPRREERPAPRGTGR
jgi:hypothetical protein